MKTITITIKGRISDEELAEEMETANQTNRTLAEVLSEDLKQTIGDENVIFCDVQVED
jgi:hypothetical protein